MCGIAGYFGKNSIPMSVIDETLKKMKERFLVPTKIILKKVDKNDSLVEIEIHEGRNHIVKHFFKFFGKHVKKLKRIAVGPINLGKLQPGKIEKLDYNELEALLKLVTK